MPYPLLGKSTFGFEAFCALEGLEVSVLSEDFDLGLCRGGADSGDVGAEFPCVLLGDPPPIEARDLD